MNNIRECFEKNNGIFRLIPAFMPRRFSKPGRRLRLHPDDYYALGTKRGAIKERWFSSVITCMNGELAAKDEGLSYVSPTDDIADKFSLRDAVELLGDKLIGKQLQAQYGTWPMYSKFFDYEAPLFHHVHPDFETAAKMGKLGKPEAYYYPPQLNNYAGEFPHTYFGFNPEVTKEMVAERLKGYEKRDTKITELSRAYRIELGTGWYTPPGVVHAPGSYLTYEPQWNSDVNSVYENICSGEVYPVEFLNENCPDDKKNDIDYLISILDWEKNTDPLYKQHYFRPPIDCPKLSGDYSEKWITYANDYFGAKELTVLPGRRVTVCDKTAYGCIMIQGHGIFGAYEAETAIMLRFGQLSNDEFFVSESAAAQGVTIENKSKFEPMVILKHFANNNPDMPQ
ncbi:MAG: hypothetical protein LBH43_14675 [Treponema sp.]|jgi:hypothetical protein|nr:hypothetical protein [Treponema sp.]